MYIYINLYLSLYIYIRRPLPELERASLQLQSPMPSNPASPKPSNPDTPPGIQASRHPSIPDCRNPLFDHLKGVTAGPSRGFQPADLLPLPPSPWPSNWCSRLHGSAKWLIGAPCLTQWNPHATQSLPSSEPNEAKGSKMEPKVIAIQAQRSPSRATWSSKHPVLSDSSLRGRRQRR